jgi:hypothetical protein
MSRRPDPMPAGVTTCLEKLSSSCLIHMSEKTLRFASFQPPSDDVQAFCELLQVRVVGGMMTTVMTTTITAFVSRREKRKPMSLIAAMMAVTLAGEGVHGVPDREPGGQLHPVRDRAGQPPQGPTLGQGGATGGADGG